MTPDGEAPRWRPGWRCALVAVAVLPIVVATVRTLRRGWVPVGDNGLLLLRTQDVLTTDHPLLGTWTSASLSVGRNLNNPGPLWFDVLAPFVRIAGPNVGFATGVMVANIAAIGLAAWCARRAGGDRALVIVTMLSVGLTWTMGSELLYDAWQPNAMLLPFWAFLIAVWALGSGDVVMAPIVVGLAGLVVQTHLSFIYVVGILGAAGVLGAWWYRRAAPTATSASLRGPLIATAAVIVVVSFQSVLDQLLGEGNLAALASSGGGSGKAPGPGLATRLVASVVALPPWWGRPSYAKTILATPLVGGTVPVGRVAGLLAALLGLLVVAAVLVAVVVVGRRQGAPHVVVLGAGAGVAVLACLLSVTVSPLNSLGLTPHQMRWMWPVAALVWAAVLVAAASAMRVADAVSTLCVVATLTLVVLTLPTYAVDAGPTADRASIGTIGRLVEQLQDYRPAQPILLDDTGSRIFEPYSGPVFAALGRAGVDVRVSAEPMARQVGGGRRADGTETRQLIIREGREARTTPPGAVRIAFVDGLDGAARDELAGLRQEVIAMASSDGLRLNEAGTDAAERGEIGFDVQVLRPGTDATELEASGWIRILAANGWLTLPVLDGAVVDRYAELADVDERSTVAVFELPVG